MGFWSSLCSAVSKAFSPIVSAIAPVLQNSPLMQKLMPLLAVVIPPPFDAIAVVALEVISAAMGKPENPEELGWQMNEADKTEKDFDSFDDYREYLDREYPFDKDAFEAQTDEQKAACRYAGMAGVMHEISEMKGIDPKLTAPALGVLTGAATSLGWSPETTRAFTQGMMTSLGGSGELFTKLPEFAKGMLDGADAVKLSDGVKAGVQESGVDTADAVKDAMGTATSANENL